MIRSEHLQFAAMLIPTLVVFVVMSLIIVMPDATQTSFGAGPDVQEYVVMDSETVPVGTIVLR